MAPVSVAHKGWFLQQPVPSLQKNKFFKRQVNLGRGGERKEKVIVLEKVEEEEPCWAHNPSVMQMKRVL